MIVILTQCFPSRIGGIENLMFNLSYFLSKDNKVLVLADQNNIIRDAIFDNKFKNNFLVRRYGGLKYFRKRNKVRELIKIINFREVKAIICDSWKSFEIPLKKLKNKNLPMICLAHGNELIIKNNSHHNRILNTLENVTKIVANSEFTKKLIKKVSPKLTNIEVIHPGVSSFENIIEEEVKLIEGSPTFLTLARLEKRKGHEFILQSISKLKNKYPNIRYIIAGEGEERSHLKSLVSSLNISKNVMFIGSINDGQKKFILNKTDLMIMPTIDESKKLSIEGFGITYIEAALFGIPSIASNVGGTKEAVLHNNTGIIIDNLDELDITISNLIENKIKMKELSENAKKRAQSQLSWVKIIKDYNKLIEETQL